MENQYNTSLKSKILMLQEDYLKRKLDRELKRARTKEEADALINEFFKRYYINVGAPLMLKRYAEEGHLPFIEDYNLTIEEIYNDLSILFEEISLIGDAMAHYFNYAQNERNRIRNRIHKITSFANDLALIANDSTKNSIFFKDSFNSRELMEEKMIIGTPVEVLTEQGIITLKRVDVSNESKNATIKLLEGDGMAGTYYLAKQKNVSTDSEDYSSNAIYVSDETPNDNPSVILDGRPDTIFEYQMVNVDVETLVSTTKGYDIDWVKGKRFGDLLRLRLVIELKEPADINWININPYHPPNSVGSIKVYSIRTSLDGFEYQPLYNVDDYVLNAELNIAPQTYRADELFDGSDDMRKAKFAGQGVWSFPARKTKFVEIVLDQDQSYEELIGHTYYERIIVTVNPETGEQIENKIRIPSSEVPSWIIKSPNGRYTIGENAGFIDKKLEVFKGWRYAIGIRDVNIMSYKYAEKSEFISKKFKADRPIRNIMLYANEKIPQEFLDVISKGNEWIKYYISFDDVNWHRISPMHHHPLGKPEDFPPKIFEFTYALTETDPSLSIYKKQIKIDKPIYEVRFKAVLERPTTSEQVEKLTPILEDYSLRVVLDEN